MIYGADIIAKVKDILDNNLNTMITTIQTERSITGVAPVANITYNSPLNNYPECFIMLGDSERDLTQIETSAELITETYDCIVSITFKDIENLWLRSEYYIEALTRVLNWYHDSDITWIMVSGTTRTELYIDTNQTAKVIAVRLQIRIN